MIKIGSYNVLKADRREESGIYLVDDENNSVLLPNAYVPEDLKLGDEIKVFIYLDSEDRIIATNLIPKITLGKFAFLAVKEINTVGAFLDMGLAKDLLVPYRQQATPMEEGKSYWVHLLLDETTNRLYGSSKINQYLSNENMDLIEGQEVQVQVLNPTDLGFNVIVNQKYKGLIFKDAIFTNLHTGAEIKGFVKKIRPDHKLDIVLQQEGISKIEPNAQKIIDFLKQNGGKSDLNDKTPPEEIYAVLGMSKKTFKKAIGTLYKQKLIQIFDSHIQLS